VDEQAPEYQFKVAILQPRDLAQDEYRYTRDAIKQS